MSKRTKTSKGLRIKLRSLNRLIETLSGEAKGLKQQLLHKEQTIERLASDCHELKQQAKEVCTGAGDTSPTSRPPMPIPARPKGG